MNLNVLREAIVAALLADMFKILDVDWNMLRSSK